jgi:hypothetical protein
MKILDTIFMGFLIGIGIIPGQVISALIFRWIINRKQKRIVIRQAKPTKEGETK